MVTNYRRLEGFGFYGGGAVGALIGFLRGYDHGRGSLEVNGLTALGGFFVGGLIGWFLISVVAGLVEVGPDLIAGLAKLIGWLMFMAVMIVSVAYFFGVRL
jgi:hypothetical protein